MTEQSETQVFQGSAIAWMVAAPFLLYFGWLIQDTDGYVKVIPLALFGVMLLATYLESRGRVND